VEAYCLILITLRNKEVNSFKYDMSYGYYVTLHYFSLIALHSLDRKLVKMPVGCGIYHINTKTYCYTTDR
jgi:hypothetical protein